MRRLRRSIAPRRWWLVLAPVATAVINVAPAQERGSASALVIILRLAGMSLGGSIALAWWTQRVQILTANLSAGASLFSGDAFEVFRAATAQAVGEAFILFAVLPCLVGLLPALQMRSEDELPVLRSAG